MKIVSFWHFYKSSFNMNRVKIWSSTILLLFYIQMTRLLFMLENVFLFLLLSNLKYYRGIYLIFFYKYKCDWNCLLWCNKVENIAFYCIKSDSYFIFNVLFHFIFYTSENLWCEASKVLSFQLDNSLMSRRKIIVLYEKKKIFLQFLLYFYRLWRAQL